MDSSLRNESRPIGGIPTEDVDFILEMVALPKERKILARGIILGLRLTGEVDGLFMDTRQPSA